MAAHFRDGQEALRQGEHTRATERFRKVLALDPNLVEARVNLGLVYHAVIAGLGCGRWATLCIRTRKATWP